MSKSKTKGWYGVSFASLGGVVHICFADSESNAREIFGVLSQGEDVFPLSWQRLSKLTGCIVPCIRKREDFATENLLFMSEGRVVSVWV